MFWVENKENVVKFIIISQLIRSGGVEERRYSMKVLMAPRATHYAASPTRAQLLAYNKQTGSIDSRELPTFSFFSRKKLFSVTFLGK